MEVVSSKGKGVVIEEIMEDDEVNEASETGYRGQSFKYPPWSSESLNEKRNKRWSEEFRFRIQLFENDFAFGLDLSQDPIDMTKVVKAKHEMQEPVYYNFHPLMYDSDYDRSISGLVGDLERWNDDDDLLQQVDPYDWQQDPYDGDDE
ncbi:hypothetical protein Tco_1271419, partial [Tanacetum coccineum]